MPAAISFETASRIKENIKYKYDSCGNISEITENGHFVARYTYDSLNRLIREDNKPLNKTVIYAYDNAGNITERCQYDYTEYSIVPHTEYSGGHYNYDYDGDKLISYNGETFEYNNLGNPTKYRGNVCVWQYGTQLTKYRTTTFVYDSLGRRTKKGSTTFWYDSDGRVIKQSDGLEFMYDASGIAGVKYGIRQFFYRKDAQGNIKEILDADGKAVIKYIYDAWGNHKTYCLDYVAGEGEFKSVDNYDRSDFNIESTKYYELAKLNPFRYRGYYYDTETKLYYLQTRYYDPEVGRFISQDSVEYADPEAINGLNLYAYCGNNPVMNIDPTGMWSWSTFWKILGVIVSIAIFVAAVVASAGAVGALAGVGAAALGLSTATVSFISSAATIGTYFVASGIALFGISDAIEIGTGGYNPIRDDLMGGNQTAYDATKITFNVLGSLATLAGSFAPKVLQKIAKSGIPKISKGKVVGYSLDFFDANGNWSYRIDATDHGNSLWHHNPHYHILGRGGNGTSVDYFWYVIKRWFIK